MKKEIPQEILESLKFLAEKYRQSPATTNAGVFLRFLTKFVTLDFVLKIFAQKLK